MFVQIVSIAVLAVVFLIATTRPINLGALAMVAAFGVGLLAAGEDFDTVISGFPVDVFILLFGVTYLFGIASVNGTIEWLVVSAARLVRDNRAAIPWALFFLAAIPTSLGAAGPAGVALLAPIALRMAERHDINPRLAGLMVVNGSNAGNFSPLNVLGVIVNGTVARNGLDVEPVWLWLGNFVFTLVLGAATFVIFGGRELVRERTRERVETVAGSGSGDDFPSSASSDVDSTVTSEAHSSDVDGPVSKVPRVATLTAIVAVATGALVFDLDIGMLAVIAAVALNLFLPASSAGALAKVSWSTVLLICGVVTYVALMQRMGTVKMIGDSVTGISVVIALAISATAVDATPFSSIGALTVASAPEAERDRLYRGLLLWGFAMVLVAPIATWLVFIVL